MDARKKIILNSLLLTVLIFAAGILLNHVFDSIRIDTIVDVMRVHELDSDSYQTERFFIEVFEVEGCGAMTGRISGFKTEIRKVGEDLGSYSRFSFFRKYDYDYLKRKYFLLELQFFSLLQTLNQECGASYLPILFFYELDDEESERQGYILQELSENFDQELVVLSFDKDYKDESLVQTMVQGYNITDAPVLIVNEGVFRGLTYASELKPALQKRTDPYAQSVNFSFTPTAAGINISLLEDQLYQTVNNNSADFFARGDAALILGRLEKNNSMICRSLEFYDLVNASSAEERAILYETSASLGCGRNRLAFLKAASKEWMLAGNVFRAKILDNLSRSERLILSFDSAAVNAKSVITSYASPILPVLVRKNISGLLIGNTSFVLNSSDVIVSQDDRVFRDWLGGQLANPYGPTLLVTFSERLTYPSSELLPEIGWHEGARIRDLKKIGAIHFPAVGTLVANNGDRWFAVDDQGVFRFEVPLDKLYYPTTRFLTKNLAVIIDTHGVNMIVEQALRHNASVVVSDCDHPGKVYAAKYLSDKGIRVICFPDKYVYLAAGHNLSLVGSPPMTFEDESAIIGNRPIFIDKKDRIVAVNASADKYALWYYQTPAAYMEILANAYDLNITFVYLEDFGQMELAVKKVREINATILATRVFNRSDYDVVSSWLSESKANKAILFHSASYPFGQKIFNEYPDQTSFDDPNPVVI